MYVCVRACEWTHIQACVCLYLIKCMYACRYLMCAWMSETYMCIYLCANTLAWNKIVNYCHRNICSITKRSLHTPAVTTAKKSRVFLSALIKSLQAYIAKKNFSFSSMTHTYTNLYISWNTYYLFVRLLTTHAIIRLLATRHTYKYTKRSINKSSVFALNRYICWNY